MFVKKLFCICGGTNRDVIPVKYGPELTLTRYMHPLQFYARKKNVCNIYIYRERESGGEGGGELNHNYTMIFYFEMNKTFLSIIFIIRILLFLR